MYTIIVNQYGAWNEVDGYEMFEDAREACERLIGESHGGDVRIVTDETAAAVQGEEVTSVTFESFNVRGELRG